MTTLDVARAYTHGGKSVIPVPFRSKNPGFNAWQNLRLTEGDLPLHFNGKPKNIGVLMGEASNWLVDVDLDHPKAIEFADQFLPKTPAIFGRPSKRRSHWEYRVCAPIQTKQYRSGAETIVEIRSTGCQTIYPPSTHPSGEQISWETEGAEPTVISPEELHRAVVQLYEAVLNSLGIQSEDRPIPASTDPSESVAFKQALKRMLRIRKADGKDGSRRLLALACRAVEHGLGDDESIRCIRACELQRPFPTQWSDDDIRKRLRSAEGKCTRSEAVIQPKKRRIEMGVDEHRVIDEAVQALSQDQEVFCRGGVLVRVLGDDGSNDGLQRTEGAMLIRQLPLPNLRERLTKVAEMFTIDEEGGENVVHPPSWLVRGVDARGRWNDLRSLVAISEVPILRPDGTVCQTPGYDASTRVLYVPTVEIPQIAGDVDIDDAVAALDQVLEVVCDFNFESKDHEAAFTAGLLTPLARHMFEGPSPLYLIDANVRGAGKGLLAQCISRVVTGRPMSASGYSHDREEMRKLITSIALAGDQMVLLDNLEGTFGNDALDRALTTTRWKDRILGRSETADLPLLTTWYATGNNVLVGADTMRRIIHVRLDVLNEHPEDRSGFRHPHLLRWVSTNRAQLLTAALTILAAFCRSGRPSQHLSAFGSFEGWSEVVREAIVWVGLPDPCNTRVKLAECADTVGDAFSQVIAAWKQHDLQNQGLVVAELLATLYPKSRDLAAEDESHVALRSAIENLVNCAPGRTPSPRQVGNRLRHYRRRVVDNVYLDIEPTQYRRMGAVWRLFDAKERS